MSRWSPAVPSDNLRGAAWILASCAGTTVMSVAIRALAPDIHSMQIAFARCIVGLALILPVVASRGFASLATRRLGLHLVRGLLAVVGINLGFYSLTVLPLLTVTAIFFTAPLFVTALAPLMLGEEVAPRRWFATGVGFLGTLVVMGFRPGGFDPVMLIAVASSLTFSLALILGKKLSATEHPSTILFYFGLITSVGCLAPALGVWRTPDLPQLLLLLTVGVFATARLYCDLRGYAIGDASFVAPFFYVRILFMGVAGYALFGEVPAANAVAGAAVIIASTLYIARREATRARGPALPSGP